MFSSNFVTRVSWILHLVSRKRATNRSTELTTKSLTPNHEYLNWNLNSFEYIFKRFFLPSLSPHAIVFKNDPMRKNWHSHFLYIIWNTVCSTLDKRMRLSRTLKGYRSPWTHSKLKYLRVSCLFYNCQDIVKNRFIQMNPFNHSLHNYHRVPRSNWLYTVPGFCRAEL